MSESRKQWKGLLLDGAVIVGSILLAFAIDAAWHGRQEEDVRAELLRGLESDFAATRERLTKSVADAELMRRSYVEFLSVAVEPEATPVDSMQRLAGQALRTVDFTPRLGAYKAAVASGGPRFIRNPEFWRAIGEFEEAHAYYDEHNRLYREIYFLGSLMDLRRDLGSLRVLYRDSSRLPEVFRADEERYHNLVSSREVHAALEAASFASRAVLEGLMQMNHAADEVLRELRGIN